jgi:phytoene synthase
MRVLPVATTPRVRASYRTCRSVAARHGRTFHLATLLLPAWTRPYVHALYAFARTADDVVDDPGSTATPAEKAARLDALGRAARTGEGPLGPAVADTLGRWQIPLDHVDAFLRSMRMDLTVTRYPTYADLLGYVHGSAAVIGRQLVPILEPASDAAYAYAEDLGVAFQLVNFVRDVGDDLRRGRVYLPLEDLDHFGVTVEDLHGGVVDGRVRRLLAYEIARARELLRSAGPGIRLLHPTSRACIRTALALYGGILDEVERADYRVLDRRVAVGRPRRARVAGAGLLRARLARP